VVVTACTAPAAVPDRVVDELEIGGTMFNQDKPPKEFPALSNSEPDRFLRDQFRFYDRHARHARWAYLGVSVTQLSLALGIASSPAFSVPTWFAPVLGGLVAFCEGAKQLFRVHDDYVSYRGTAETLRQEAWLYSQHAGPYRDARDKTRLMVERTLALTKQETAAWAQAMQHPAPAG
jgi:hypothetical protein